MRRSWCSTIRGSRSRRRMEASQFRTCPLASTPSSRGTSGSASGARSSALRPAGRRQSRSRCRCWNRRDDARDMIFHRRLAAVPVLLALTAASTSAQTSRFALEPVASIDASSGSDVPRYTQIWLDVFAAYRLADGLDVVARPVVNRRPFDGVWQKQIYQLGLRYERPG